VADRRAFIGSMAAGLLAAPVASFAQQPARVSRIGILANTEGSAWDGFRRGLRELGYVEGGNLAIEWRWADGRVDRYPELAAELVRSNVALIVTSSTSATQAAKRATATIPILMTNSAYPDKMGLVETLARPGGNITGFSNFGPELVGKSLALFKELAPKTSRIGVLWSSANPIEAISLREATTAAAAIGGMEIVSVEVRAPEEYAAAFASMIERRVDAIKVFGNPVNFKNFQPIVDFALKNRLASAFDERAFVDAGGLFSYGSSFVETYRRAATYVDKILKGAKPGELPIQHPTKFDLVLNLKTARALGLAIAPSLLLRVDDLVQ